MNLQQINPWQWQSDFGYAQAVEVKQNEGTLYCAGQAAIDAEGRPVDGSMEEQIALTLQNLKTVAIEANYELKNVVRLNVYTTSVSETFAAWATITGWLQKHHAVPACTLLEASALAFPQLKVEIEATLVK